MKRLGWFSMLLWLAACQPGEEAGPAPPKQTADAQRPQVYSVNYPLAWMAEQIGGDRVDVVFPVPPGLDPAHWRPSPERVLEYQAADRVLANGAGYAPWIRFASLSPAKLVNTTRGLEERLLPAQSGSHRHGPGGQHQHGGAASHTWLDSTLAAEQARAVAEALARIVPESAAEFEQRLERVLAALDRTDRAMASFFSALPPTQIFYSHPVYQYLDARFELDGRAFAWEPDHEPEAAEWQRLEAAVDHSRSALMLWEAAPLDSVAARLRALGITAVVFETGANPDDRDGYDSLLQRNLNRLQASRPDSTVPEAANRRPASGG